MQLPIDLAKDQEMIVSKVLNLLSSCVDVLSSEGHLNATSAMEMSQMVVQAMWDRDSPLLQIPHFTNETVDVLAKEDINDIEGLMEALDPSENKDYQKLIARMGLNNKQLQDAAAFTNEKYPNIELDFDVLDKDAVTAGEGSYLQVKLTRADMDEDDEEEQEVDLAVHAPFYPTNKTENWWLVVSEEKERNLLAIKRITIAKRVLDVKLEYIVPKAGQHKLNLLLISDSYLGVDQSVAFEVTAAEGEDEEEDEDEEMEG